MRGLPRSSWFGMTLLLVARGVRADVKLGDYPLTDQTYARLLEAPYVQTGTNYSGRAKKNILEFYAHIATASEHLTARLNALKGMKTVDQLE